MTQAPAICLNPLCNTIFPSGFGISGEGQISTYDCTSGPCPRCGGMGKIPDGSHSLLNGRLLTILENVNDIHLIKKVSLEIKRELSRKKSPKSIKKKLNKKYPPFKRVWELIPETKQDAYAVINIILGITMAVTAIGSCSKTDEPTIINQTNNYIYHEHHQPSQHETPSYSHKKKSPIQDKLTKI